MPLSYGEAESAEEAEEARARLDEMMGAKAGPAMPPGGFGGLGALSFGGLGSKLDLARDERGLLMRRLVRIETEIMALERLVR